MSDTHEKGERCEYEHQIFRSSQSVNCPQEVNGVTEEHEYRLNCLQGVIGLRKEHTMTCICTCSSVQHYMYECMNLKDVIGFRNERINQLHCLLRNQCNQKGESASVHEESNRSLLYKMQEECMIKRRNRQPKNTTPTQS